jgi:hypothetical protein
MHAVVSFSHVACMQGLIAFATSSYIAERCHICTIDTALPLTHNIYLPSSHSSTRLDTNYGQHPNLSTSLKVFVKSNLIF